MKNGTSFRVQIAIPLVIVVRAGLSLGNKAPPSQLNSRGLPQPPHIQRTEIKVTEFQESALDYSMETFINKASGSLGSVHYV